MGIYIRGMKIPPNCGFCNLLYHCTTHIGEEINLYIRNICRHPDCPLIEVKSHGRLVDIDAVYKDICNSIEEMTKIGFAVDAEYLWGKLNDAIDNAPTVIEAEI